MNLLERWLVIVADTFDALRSWDPGYVAAVIVFCLVFFGYAVYFAIMMVNTGGHW